MNPNVHTLTGAYALHALEELEARQFEAHLVECPDCAREVAELRATAARLATAEAIAPPPRLRERVMSQLATTRQDPPAAEPATPGARPRAPIRRARRTAWLAAAAAGVAAAAALVLGVLTVHTAQQRDAARTELAQLQAQYQPLARLAAAPDARVSTGAGVHGGTVFVLASHLLNQAVLVGSDLPTPPPGRTYQAWLLGAGQPRSIGLLRAGPAGKTSPLDFGELDGAVKIGLTLEPVGGSPQPTTTPVVLFNLPA